MPTDRFLKVANRAHRALVKVSAGRLGWRVAKMPVVELTTTGRRSGRARTVMLTSPAREGDTYVLVASRGGDNHHPAWFHNLQAEPEVEVRIGGGDRHRRLARVATPAERERIWPQVTETYSNYAAYQRRTRREIPLVLLEPLP